MFARLLGRAALLAVVAPLVLLWPARAAAQQPADEATINRRIEMGVAFLKKQQKPDGYWVGTGAGSGKGFGVGYNSLVGMTLIECGVPTSDPGLKRAAALVRSVAQDLDDTYELALAILFLDRMKDKVDKRVIQLLAGRLISAQMPSGGWGYKTHKYAEPGVLQLLAALRKLSGPDGATADANKLKLSVPVDMRRLAVWDDTTGRLNADPKEKRSDLYDATTDNSNTHFAMVGLWAARKYDIPVDRTFALTARRFRTSQGAGGTWAYDFNRTGADGGHQFTCIALLAVAIGHVVSPPDVKPEADPVIIKAFTSLGAAVGEPVGDTANRPKIKDIPGGLYFMWAMERIAVLYDLQKLGKKDWYLWGAEILVSNQLADGSWEEGGFPGQTPVANTCLSLLFLRRANLTPDLAKKLTVDTGVLIAKVETKPEPKVEPPPMPTKVVEPPPPPKVEEPKPTPKVEEPKPAPAPKVEPVAEAPAPAPPKKSPLIWIILGTLLAAIVGGGLAFLVYKRMQGNDDEDAAATTKPKKKGKSAKAEGAKPAKAEGTKKTAQKVKQDVEVDEDE